MSSIPSVSEPVFQPPSPVEIKQLDTLASAGFESRWADLVAECGQPSQKSTLPWTRVLCESLQYRPRVLYAEQGDTLVGVLPLVEMQSLLFGKLLVSLPYVNSAGVVASCPNVRSQLVDAAVRLADAAAVKRLEIRQEIEIAHADCQPMASEKRYMRLTLDSSVDAQWNRLKAKVRNQVRKGEKNELTWAWGQTELLPDFYRVFSQNMRDLGTPVYSRQLFAKMLDNLSAEICVIRAGRNPIAAALIIHGADGVTEVPSASSLRAFNRTNANMLMYWQLIKRTIERGQTVFDFGRSSADSPTFRFKRQWGAESVETRWLTYLRRGTDDAARPESGKFSLAIRAWQKLPVWVSNIIGPPIVRGIP